MQKSQSLRLGGERRRLSGGVFHQRLHAEPVRPGDVRAAALGRYEDARGDVYKRQRANNIMQALVSCSLFPSIKHILKTQGVDCGGCRKPFPTLTEGQKAYIERVVKENM